MPQRATVAEVQVDLRVSRVAVVQIDEASSADVPDPIVRVSIVRAVAHD